MLTRSRLIELDIADDRGEKELDKDSVKHYQAIVGSLIDSNDRKSQSGPVFLTCHDGGAISWQSRKQDLITLSTLEAEYITCSEASREATWLLQLQRDIHGPQNQTSLPSSALPIYYDNQGALTHITTGVIKARTKHIDVCYHNS